jgi:hypothetical protein
MFQFAEVGGAVRDSLLGVDSDDVDFVAISENQDLNENADVAFSGLVNHLKLSGFEIFEERPQFFTVRAKVPADNPLSQRTHIADFVLARKDGPSSDGRRPDFVLPGTLMDDLKRRDFTINAMARLNGVLIDPFGGQDDLQAGLIRFVGNPVERIAEDGLRVLRAIRFAVTKGFDIDAQTWDAIDFDFSAEMLLKVSADRIRGELLKMFSHDTILSLNILSELNSELQKAIFRDGLHLTPSLKKISKKHKV